MRRLLFFCAALIVIAYLTVSASATAMKVCENAAACFDSTTQQAESSTTVVPAAAVLGDSDELEEMLTEQVTVPIAGFTVNVKRRKRIITIGKPPLIRMSRSSILIGDTCYLGCSWFYLESTKQSLCRSCASMVAYKPQTKQERIATNPKKVGKKTKAKTKAKTKPVEEEKHICFDLPNDIRTGRIPVNFTNYAKDLCAQSCKCSNETIRNENVVDVQVHRAKAFAIFNTMMNWTTSAVDRYYAGVNHKLNLLTDVKSKKCADRRAIVLKSQQDVVKSLREAAEETRAVMTIAQANILGDDAITLLNEFVATFNKKSTSLHALMKSQVKTFAKSLNGLCVSDQITMGIAQKNERKQVVVQMEEN